MTKWKKKSYEKGFTLLRDFFRLNNVFDGIMYMRSVQKVTKLLA